MSDNISIAKIDVDASGVIKAAKDIVDAGATAQKAFQTLASGVKTIENNSKAAADAAKAELVTVQQTEARKTMSRQASSKAKIALAESESKVAVNNSKQELEQVEQAEKRKTQLAKTRADQRLVNTKSAAKQEESILNASLRAKQSAMDQEEAKELLMLKASIRATQDAEKAKQTAQKQTFDLYMARMSQVNAASARGGIKTGQTLGGLGGGATGGGGGGITPPSPPGPPSGGGPSQVGGFFQGAQQVGAGLGGNIALATGLAASIATLNIPGVIVNLGLLGKAFVDTGKDIFQAGIAAEKTAVAYQRQIVAASNLAGSQRNLAKIMDAYVEASGGAVDTTEALTSVIQLQALGFAKSAESTKEFVTAARGISLAMGKTVTDVANEITLAVGNLSTRRLDQLGLSIQEVTDRTNELQKAHVGMSRQMAFEQAILEAADKKFGDLAKSAEGQKSPVERMEADWNNFYLTMANLVAPAVDKVADALDKLIKKATDKGLQQGLENIANTTLIRVNQSPEQARQYGTETLTTEATKAMVDRLTQQIAELKRIQALPPAQRDQYPDFAGGKTPPVLAELEKELEMFSNDMARLNARNMLAQSKIPGGPQLPYTEDPARPSGAGGETALQRFERENQDMIIEHHDRELSINRDAYNDQLAADADYHQAVEKSNKAFNQQQEEQLEDHNKQMAKMEKDYQDEIKKVKRDAAEQAKKMERDLNTQIDKERRDAAAEQKRWLRDYNDTVFRNNRDEKAAEARVNRDYGEQVAKENTDYNNKVKDINDKFKEDQLKRTKDHNETLMEAAGRLDAVAVYAEQRRFLKEQAEAKKARDKDLADEKKHHEDTVAENEREHKEQIKDIQDANNQRNIDEKAAYDQRVSDAQTALNQQIEDQKTALATQLDDAKKADDQRLSDMKTAHDNQKTEMDTAFNDQITRQQKHHNDELTELDTQH